MQELKKDIIGRLQKDILLWQGYTPPQAGKAKGIGLGPLESAFPNGVFPTGAVHEMLCFSPEQSAATSGLLAGLIGALMKNEGACLWISLSRKLFPAALAAFNVEPDRVIFVDLQRERDVLWATEEALKCKGLAAVIAEVGDITFAQSQRLQMAVEKSRVTGFVLRNNPKKMSTTAFVARWQITPLPSELEADLPGVGLPRWQVDLLRVRNGEPGSWKLEWVDNSFVPLEEKAEELHLHQTRIAG